MGKLEGKIAIITGAARGIGAAAARLFADEGAKVMLADVLAEPLQVLAAALGDRAAWSVTDVTDEGSVKKLVDDALARFGRLDVALLNAGIEGQVKSIGAGFTVLTRICREAPSMAAERIRPITACLDAV